MTYTATFNRTKGQCELLKEKVTASTLTELHQMLDCLAINCPFFKVLSVSGEDTLYSGGDFDFEDTNSP